MKFWKQLIIFFLLYTNVTFGETKITDKIVAIINQNIILNSDIKNYIKMMSPHIPTINNNSSQHDISLIYQNALNQLIIDTLISQIAKQENISITSDQLNHIINHIANQYNMSLNQFHTHIHDIGINYTKYHSQLNQEILKQNICEHIVFQRAHLHISPQEINKTIQKLNNNINFNKQFKLIHIIFSLPIHPTLDQINNTTCLAKSLIKLQQNHKTLFNSLKQIKCNNDIFQIITTQETEWISWKNMPVILNEYLYTDMKKGNIIGPIHSYDGIHIIKIKDVRNKHSTLPITKINIKNIILNTTHTNENSTKQLLLKIKKHLENNVNIPNEMTLKKIENPYSKKYTEYLEWKYLDEYTPAIQKILLSLKINEISTPIHTYFGWQLIQLKNILTVDTTEVLQERAYLYLLNQKFNDIINHWISEIKSKSYIKIIQ